MSEINDQDQQTRTWLNQTDDPEHDTLATDNDLTADIIRAHIAAIFKHHAMTGVEPSASYLGREIREDRFCSKCGGMEWQMICNDPNCTEPGAASTDTGEQ